MPQNNWSNIFVIRLMGIILPFCLFSYLSAQPGPKILWTKKVNCGTTDIKQTQEGNFITLGDTGTEPKLFIQCNDSLGNRLWKKTYGDENGCIPRKIEVLKDGSLVAIADKWSKSSTPNKWLKHLWVLRFNKNGDTVGTFILNENDTIESYSTSVVVTEDSGFVVAGGNYYQGAYVSLWENIIVLKFNSQGNLLWTKSYPNNFTPYYVDISPLGDGGFLIASSVCNISKTKCFPLLIRLDNKGDTLWTNIVNLSDSTKFTLKWIKGTNDNGFIISGYNTQFFANNFQPTREQINVIKVNSSGVKQWEKHYGYALDARPYAEVTTPDNGAMICGYYSYANSHYMGCMWLLRLNASGDTSWTRMFTGVCDTFGGAMISLRNNQYIIAGSIDSGSDDRYSYGATMMLKFEDVNSNSRIANRFAAPILKNTIMSQWLENKSYDLLGRQIAFNIQKEPKNSEKYFANSMFIQGNMVNNNYKKIYLVK